jgi:hypothetical protein
MQKDLDKLQKYRIGKYLDNKLIPCRCMDDYNFLLNIVKMIDTRAYEDAKSQNCSIHDYFYNIEASKFNTFFRYKNGETSVMGLSYNDIRLAGFIPSFDYAKKVIEKYINKAE